MYNIKEITTKIIKKGYLNPKNYPLQDRVDDVNQALLELVEIATQRNSNQMLSGNESFTDIFTLPSSGGDFTFDRTIEYIPIVKIEWTSVSSPSESDWREVNIGGGKYCTAGMSIVSNEQKIFVFGALQGQIRVTYTHGIVNMFTVADVNLPTPPSPDIIPYQFRELLVLKPLLPKLAHYKPERYNEAKQRYEELLALFEVHYMREAEEEFDVVNTNYR